MNVQAVVDLILEKHKNLNQETARHWTEIVNRTYNFDRNVEDAAVMASLTLPELLDFYDRHFSVGGAGRRKLASWVYGNQYKIGEEEKQSQEEEGSGGDEKAEGAEGGGVSSKSVAEGDVKVDGFGKRELVIVDEYNGFKRSMPLLPLKRPTPVALTAAAMKPSKL